MSDDIVTRLRAYNIGNIGHEASSHMEETLYEAADEIERLRADRDRWLHIARRLYELIPERSSEALRRASVLRDYEESAHQELEKGLLND